MQVTKKFCVVWMLLFCAVETLQASVVFTEYVEGSGHNKALELTNFGQDIIDLADIKVGLYHNGRAWHDGPSATITLSGELLPRASFVVANRQGEAALTQRADYLTHLSFNGDDALVMTMDEQVLDVFGQVGVDPGQFWKNGTVQSKDLTLRRMDFIDHGGTHPEAAFDIGQQWVAIARDQFKGLGCSGEQDCVVPPASDCSGNHHVTIAEIQGTGARSPLVPVDKNQSDVAYSTQGIVTAVLSDLTRGFFIQDSQKATEGSSGLFVYTPSDLVESIHVGDTVCVHGRVKEFMGLTEIVLESFQNQGRIHPAISPVPLDLHQTSADTLTEQLERYEGMLVELPKESKGWVVSRSFGFDFKRRRDNLLLARHTPLLIPTQIYPALTPQASALRVQNDQRQLVVETDPKARQGKIPWFPDFHPQTGYLRVSDQVYGLQGVLSQYGQWQLIAQNQIMPSQVVSDGRQQAPTLQHDGDVRVASFNVYNFFTSPFSGKQNPTRSNRGAQTRDEFTLQRQKLVAAIHAMDADIVGLMELENNGFSSGSSLQSLVTALNQQQPDVSKRYQVAQWSGGFIGTDAITNGIIYRSSIVQARGALEILDLPRQQVRVDGRDFNKTQRPAVIQEFLVLGKNELLTVAVNHLKSKGSPCYEDYPDELTGDTLDGQGRCNEFRVSAAVVLGEALKDREGSVLIIGDMNAYAEEDPLLVLTDQLYRTQGRKILTSAHTYLGDELLYVSGQEVKRGYPFKDVFSNLPQSATYSFEGEQGRLDTILANARAMPLIVDRDIWSINSAESPLFGYSSKYSGALEKSPDMFRSSDHDPALVVLDFSQKPPALVAFKESVVRVHPDAKDVRIWLERKALQLDQALVVAIKTPWNTRTLRWAPGETRSKFIQLLTPKQETTLKVVAINGEMTTDIIETEIQLDLTVKSVIEFRQAHMQADEGYLKLAIPIVRRGDVSQASRVSVAFTSESGRVPLNYMPLTRHVRWKAWDPNEKIVYVHILRDWFGFFDFDIEVSLHDAQNAEIGSIDTTVVHIANTDLR